MTHFKRYTAGMTLIESLIALGIASIIFMSGFGLFNLLFSSKSEVDKRKLTKDLLLENLIEAKGIPLTSLPATNNCKIRTYDIKGNFINETTVADITANCGINSPTNGIVYIFLKMLPGSSISVTYNPSAFLKLPTYANTVSQIEIKSILIGSNNQEYKNEVIFFKK